MDQTRVERAIREILGQTERGEIRAGRNLAMTAQRVGRADATPAFAEGFDVTGCLFELGEKDGGAEQVLLALYFRSERLSGALVPLARPDSPLFRLLAGASTTGEKPVRHVRAADPELFRDLFSLIAVAYAERPEGWEATIEALALAVVVAISPEVPDLGPRGTDDVIAAVLAEISARPDRVSLAELAERYSYSVTYLSELIHERCGRTFTELVRDERMERARSLLQATELPVAEVARRVGYAGTSNFHRAFRERFGCTPSELRNGRAQGRA